MKKILTLILIAFAMQLQAQSENKTGSVSESVKNNPGPEKMNFGVELDFLPYATGGYFGAAWVGKDKWRGRALLADVNFPDILTKDGFTNHHIQSYAVVVDRFLDDNWKGWWIGAGPVYWKSNIQSDSSTATKDFYNVLLNGSLGYNFIVYKNFYLSSWAGLSFKVAGNDQFVLDNKEYKQAVVNPEASVKCGFYF